MGKLCLRSRNATLHCREFMSDMRIRNTLDTMCVKTMVRRLPILSAINGAMINEIAFMMLDTLNMMPR